MAAEPDLVVTRLQMLDVVDRRLDHRQPVLGGRDVALADLLPRHVGDHQDQSIEGKRMADVDGGDQMPDVGRIERAPEQPDVLGSFGALRTRPTSLRGSLHIPVAA